MRNRFRDMIRTCIVTAAALTPALPAAGHDAPPAVTRGTLLIIHDPALQEAANEWAAYRSGTGWRAILLAMDADKSVATKGNDPARMLRETIHQHWHDAHETDPERFMVLLLGDAPAATETTLPGVPTWRFPQADPDMRLLRDRMYATDHPYQLMDDADDLPDIPLGRIPARSNAQALAALEKIKTHETPQEMTSGRDRVTYVAGEGHYGLMDNVLEAMFKVMVDQLVPPAFDVSMTYAKPSSIYCPPPSRLSDTVLQRLGEGCLLFNYVGHGFERGFDWLTWGSNRIPILLTEDMPRLDQFAAPDAHAPIALLTCCSTGWFDLPNDEHCLAEAMLFDAGDKGPVAVIAGSRVTHPYANIIVQKDVTQRLLNNRVSTLGMLDLLAARSLMEIDEEDRQIDQLAAPIALAGKWHTSLPNLRRMHMRLYNLLGDPAMSIPQPPAPIENLALDGLRLSGTVPGMVTGTAHILIETPRTSIARPSELKTIQDLPGGDPDLDAKAAHNYPLAQNRVLERLEAPVRDGRFEVTLSTTWPDEAAVIRVLARGTCGDGGSCDAAGALAITARTKTTN